MVETPGSGPYAVDQVKQNSKSPLTRSVGSSGLRQFSGYIREEFIRELTGRAGREVLDEMANNDSTCGALLFAIKNLLRAMEWAVEPSDPNDERSKEAADMVEEALFNDMTHTWPEFIENVCSMFTYGFQITEIVWKKRKGLKPGKPWESSEFDDGLYAPATFKSIGQKTIERWVYDDEEHCIGFDQYPWNGPQITVPLQRCMHFRTTTEMDNPEGKSLLRTAYRSWYWLKRMQEIEGIGTERDLAGYPVLRVPGDMLDPAADADQLAAKAGYEEFLRSVRRDQQEGVLLPSDRDENGNYHYEFELMSSGGSRQLRIDESITRYQKDIARSVLADFIFLGADGGGSLALGDVKIQFFVEALKGYANHVVEKVNEVAIPQMWKLNGLDDEIRPRVTPGKIEEVDLQGMAAYLKSLADVGFDLSTDTELENHMRLMADMPQAPDRTEDDDFFEMPSGRAVKKPAVPGYDANGNPMVDADGNPINDEAAVAPGGNTDQVPNKSADGKNGEEPDGKQETDDEEAVRKMLTEALGGHQEADSAGGDMDALRRGLARVRKRVGAENA